MQKISSFHKLILKMQQNFGSHELNGYAHFWPRPDFVIKKTKCVVLHMPEHYNTIFRHVNHNSPKII